MCRHPDRRKKIGGIHTHACTHTHTHTHTHTVSLPPPPTPTHFQHTVSPPSTPTPTHAHVWHRRQERCLLHPLTNKLVVSRHKDSARRNPLASAAWPFCQYSRRGTNSAEAAHLSMASSVAAAAAVRLLIARQRPCLTSTTNLRGWHCPFSFWNHCCIGALHVRLSVSS